MAARSVFKGSLPPQVPRFHQTRHRLQLVGDRQAAEVNDSRTRPAQIGEHVGDNFIGLGVVTGDENRERLRHEEPPRSL